MAPRVADLVQPPFQDRVTWYFGLVRTRYTPTYAEIGATGERTAMEVSQ